MRRWKAYLDLCFFSLVIGIIIFVIDRASFHLLFESLKKNNSVVVFAESLTGGLISSQFSRIPGVSSVLWGGFVVYSPFAKEKVLGVSREIIKKHGVVSAECASSMAEGALDAVYFESFPSALYSLSVTGLAGPASSSDSTSFEDSLPIGTVYMAVAKKTFDSNIEASKNLAFSNLKVSVRSFLFEGDREEIQEKTANEGVRFLLEILN